MYFEAVRIIVKGFQLKTWQQSHRLAQSDQKPYPQDTSLNHATQNQKLYPPRNKRLYTRNLVQSPITLGKKVTAHLEVHGNCKFIDQKYK